jgi:hypothetical protein
MKSFRRKNRKTRTRRRKQFKGGVPMIRCNDCQYEYGRNKCTTNWLGRRSCECPMCKSTNYTEFEKDFAPTGMLSNSSGLPSGQAYTRSQGTPLARTVPVLPSVATRLSGAVSALPVASVSALPVANATR